MAARWAIYILVSWVVCVVASAPFELAFHVAIAP